MPDFLHKCLKKGWNFTSQAKHGGSVLSLEIGSDIFIHQLYVDVGEAAASGAGAREGHERAGAGNAAERERGRIFQDLG